MRASDLQTIKLCKSPTRISKLHWDLAKYLLDGLHIKMIEIHLGVPEIAWGSKGQWWWWGGVSGEMRIINQSRSGM